MEPLCIDIENIFVSSGTSLLLEDKPLDLRKYNGKLSIAGMDIILSKKLLIFSAFAPMRSAEKDLDIMAQLHFVYDISDHISISDIPSINSTLRISPYSSYRRIAQILYFDEPVYDAVLFTDKQHIFDELRNHINQPLRCWTSDPKLNQPEPEFDEILVDWKKRIENQHHVPEYVEPSRDEFLSKIEQAKLQSKGLIAIRKNRKLLDPENVNRLWDKYRTEQYRKWEFERERIEQNHLRELRKAEEEAKVKFEKMRKEWEATKKQHEELRRNLNRESIKKKEFYIDLLEKLVEDGRDKCQL